MIIVEGILIIVSICLFVFAYLVWKKQKFQLLAGYTSGSVSDEDKPKFAKMNGIMISMYGILLFIYAFTFTKVNFYLAFIIFIVFTLVHILIVNINFKKND